MWVRLQIDVLWDTCTTDTEIVKALESLPKSLDETYERCLERVRVREKQSPYALRVLRYVHQTTNPFTVDALGEALAIDPYSGMINPEQIPENRFVISCGANLVMFDELEQYVLPAHHSVRQFLENSASDVLEQLRRDIWEDADLTLGEICIIHLSCHASERARKPAQDLQPTTTQLPSIPKMSKWLYSPQNFMSRLRKPSLALRKSSPPIPEHSPSPVMLKLAPSRSRAQTLYEPLHSYARVNWMILTRSLTSESIYWNQLRELVFQEHDDPQLLPWNSARHNGSAKPRSTKFLVRLVGWAIASPHVQLLELAIHQSGSPQLTKDALLCPLEDYDNLLPLHLAARLGHLEIMKSLWKVCDVSVQCPNSGWTALHYAVEQRHLEVVESLLRSVRSLMTVCGNDSLSPLSIAMYSGSHEIIRAMRKIYGKNFWRERNIQTLVDDDTFHKFCTETSDSVFETLLEDVATGQSDTSTVDYVLRGSVDRSDHILHWTIKNEAIHLLPSISRAGISLDTRICAPGTSDEADGDRTLYPPILFAMEARMPDLAQAFIKNGADFRNPVRSRYPKPNGATLRPIDLALSCGWIDLVSQMSVMTPNSHSGEPLSFEVLVKDLRVCWLSILVTSHNISITGIACTSHYECHFRDRDWRPQCLYISYDQVTIFHALRISLSRSRTNFGQLRVMLGTRETNPTTWRTPSDTAQHGSETLDATIKYNGHEANLTLNDNLYNLQHLFLDSDALEWSEDGCDWIAS